MDLKLKVATWDLDLENGRDLIPATAIEQVKQCIKIRLQTQLKEWQFDQECGLPYLETIFIKGMPTTVIAGICKLEIEKVKGVVSVTSANVELDPIERRLTGTFTVSTDYGVVDISL